MRRLLVLYFGVLLFLACAQNDATPTWDADNDEKFGHFAAKVDSALGTFNDIKVFEWDSASGAWLRRAGYYVPITVNDSTPSHYTQNMKADRQMMLPTDVQGSKSSDGQAAPYSVVGRMPGSNPEVQWVFVVRQYKNKDTTDRGFPISGDIAVIGHHPRTGATVFLQFYDPDKPRSGEVVISPSSPNAARFWSPIKMQADSFQCQRCHNTGPFIHTPWINQVTVRPPAPNAPPPEPVVPSDPLGPYFFIDSDADGLFWKWDAALVANKGGGHLNKPDNKCTQCHRIAPGMIGLNQNATRYAGLGTGRNAFSIASDAFQTPGYDSLRWMPPVAMPAVDFYAGQKAIDPTLWRQTYGASAAEINLLEDTTGKNWKKAHQQGIVADVPRPPTRYRTIVVDRENQDQVGPNQSLWILDSRMRANTDGDLEQWRFFGKGPANNDLVAAPVVYRRRPNDGDSIVVDVVFVGEPRRYGDAGPWLAVQPSTFSVRLGDYFGVVFTNTGAAQGNAIVPYSDDDWAKLKSSDGTTWLRDGSVTYRRMTDGSPGVGRRLTFVDAHFRTYSFEFKSKY